MVALFDDVSVFHYQDDISALDGGKSVGYDEASAAFHHFGECVLDPVRVSMEDVASSKISIAG